MKSNRRHRRLNLTEIRSIIEYYRPHFPEWRVVRKDTLIRDDDPIMQGITFERLSNGDYRLTGYIRVLVAPEDQWGFELPQDLNVQLRNIDRRRDTPATRLRVVEAVRAEFVPSVERPLVAEKVLNLYEQETVPTSPEAYSLAALNAYLGHEKRALYWCSRFPELIKGPWQDYDHRRQAFLERLESWLKAGIAKYELERVLHEERRKWGLT